MRRSGLFDEEVERRREQFGCKEESHEKPPACYQQLWHAFANPFDLLIPHQHGRETGRRRILAGQRPSNATARDPNGELVPGGIVYLSAGDLVPADVRRARPNAKA